MPGNKEFNMFWWTSYFNAVDRMVLDYQVGALKALTHNYFTLAAKVQTALDGR